VIRLSTKGRYAVRILVRIALAEDAAKPSRKQDIAKAEGMSGHYVEQILMKLKTAGLVRSHRGINGGFTLGKKPDKMTVADVLKVTEGSLSLVPCFTEGCYRIPFCATRAMWKKAGDALNSVLSETTIAGLVNEARLYESGKALTFEI
jgi:Rrf2 family protein